MVKLVTRRFGVVQRPEDEIITFPSGILGFELNRQWLLMGDRAHRSLFWLQNVEQIDLSLAVVTPCEFVTPYALHVQRKQLTSIWGGTEPLIVLSVLTEYEQQLCLNLCNPVVINPNNRLGRQVVASDDRPLQYALPEQALPLRKSA